MSKIFLLLPFDVGLAHVLRCLAVGEALTKKGHRAIVTLPKKVNNRISLI